MSAGVERSFEAGSLYDKPVVQKEIETPKAHKPVSEIAEKWIANFNEAIQSKDATAVAALFLENGSMLSDLF